MGILDELLKNVEKSEVDEQLKIICDKIMKEEKVRKGQLCNIEMPGFCILIFVPYC